MQQDERPRLVGGMFNNTSPLDQPAGTVRFARNALLNETLGAWTNEHGTRLSSQLPQNSTVIGCIPLTDDRVVLFIRYGVRSQIGLWTKGSYTPIYDPVPTPGTDLNFSEDHPISGTFKQMANGDMAVYWTDDLNPPRSLNITRQQGSPSQFLYGLNPQNSPDTLQSGRLNLFPHSGPVPHIELEGVYSGGGIRTGSYYPALGYRDSDLVKTNTLTVGNPVPIVDEHEGVQPIESYDGSPPDVLSGKSITWTVSNINTDYKYLTVSVIATIGEVRFAYELKDIEILGRSTIKVTFTGQQTTLISSPESVLTDRVEYARVKTMEQLEGSLYLGNLTDNVDIGYQPYANYIKSKPCIHPLHDLLADGSIDTNGQGFDPFLLTDDFLMRKSSQSLTSQGFRQTIQNGYRWPKNVHDLKGYQRDEVYAFYIAFILKSGKMSMAYHIPGRPPLKDVNLMQNISNLERFVYGNDQISTPTVDEDRELYYQGINNWDIINLTGNPAENDPDALGRMYQWFDFSMIPQSRGMNFWMNLSEFYPDTDDWRVRDAQTPSPVGDLRAENVRHHRFPGNRNPDYTTVKSSNATELGASLKKKKKMVVRWFWFKELTRDVSGGKYFTINDPYQGTDWQGARTHANGRLGGRGPNHNDDIEEAFEETRFYSCRPDLNIRFLNNIAGITGSAEDVDPIIHNIDAGLGGTSARPWQQHPLGCLQEEVEYRYDTKLPASAEFVFVAWDFPSGSWSACAGIPPTGNTAPHCYGAFAAKVKEVTPTSIRVESADNCNIYHPRHDMSRGGFVAWVECEDVLDNDPSNVLRQEVRALGICFDDIKVPKSIADQVQGFRIYYAKRTHENRTIIGQCPIHPMQDKRNVNVAGCHQFNANVRTLDYWHPGGVPYWTDPDFERRTYSFHDFYLLRETPSLAQATHLRLQYSLGMFSFAGPTEYYVDGVNSDPNPSGSPPPPAIFSCFRPEVITSFHLSGDHQNYFGALGSTPLNWLLQDKARAYVLGNTIYEAAGSGFELPIYNIGGHTHVALRTARDLPYMPSGYNAGWRQLRSDNAGLRYEGYWNDPNHSFDEGIRDKGLMLHMVNLHAFKTDVYAPVDSQQLVWTGFEVTGERFNDFVVPEDLRSPVPGPNAPNGQAFTTGPVFGGDTYICRYGYRMTHREEVSSVPFTLPDTAAIDHKSVIMTIVESTENINFRHVEQNNLTYFPGDALPNVLKVKADVDLTYHPDPDTGNIRYNRDYSATNDLKAIIPYPFQLIQNERFPFRVIRSDTSMAGNLEDMFRYYRAFEFRDLTNRYGELWELSAMANRMLFHMEDSLLISRGRQRVKVSEGEDAEVGSGDIFQQEPELVLHTDAGFLGTRSSFSCLVTPKGYFFVDTRNRRVMMTSDRPEDLSSDKYGMEDWFRRNLPYALEDYGVDIIEDSFITGPGFHAVWDQKFERIILTKRDLVPTQEFKDLFKGTFDTLPVDIQGIVSVKGKLYLSRTVTTFGLTTIAWDEIPLRHDSVSREGDPLFKKDGWTISFKVSQSEQRMGAWESFHDYVPYMYSYTGTDVISFNDGLDRLCIHDDITNPGLFYGTLFPFEIEAVIRTEANIDLLFHAFSFLTETFTTDPQTSSLRTDHHAGFTSFSAYTSDHFTGESPLEYLINMRRIGSEWRVNQLRDLSKQMTSTAAYYTPTPTQSLYPQGLTVTGVQSTGTVKGSDDAFYVFDGMYSTPNPNAIDTTKPWFLQGKMAGRYMGVRLVADNIDRKLINLHTVLADHRPYKR